MPEKKPNSPEIKVTYVPVGDLRPNGYSPRSHDDTEAERLRESVTRHGMIDPIIANATANRRNIVIGGQFRLEVAKSLGMETVPVVYVDVPDLKREKEIALRLNNNVGHWDLEALRAFDIPFLEDVGFSDEEIADIWEDALEAEDDDFDVEQALREIKDPTVKPGEIYKLGEHLLACIDSTDPAQVKRLMSEPCATMINCDIPYNIGLDYNKGIGSTKRYGGDVDDRKSQKDYREFVSNLLANSLSLAKPDAHVFYWCDQNWVWLIQTLFAEAGLVNRRTCLWIKNAQNPTPQVAFSKVYEPCCYATRGKAPLSDRVQNLNEILNKDFGTGNRLADDILDALDLWVVRREPGRDYQHPTQKPPSLHYKALRRCTRPGDTVVDLVCGSGSQLIACEQMKRRCVAAEKSPVFTQVIIDRYEELTGTKAKRVS
jgi:DNA modification methylase